MDTLPGMRFERITIKKPGLFFLTAKPDQILTISASILTSIFLLPFFKTRTTGILREIS
jgi:hypothetical protein